VLQPGRDTEASRVMEGDSSHSFWIGQILVASNPVQRLS
jgi:hypothetical protein